MALKQQIKDWCHDSPQSWKYICEVNCGTKYYCGKVGCVCSAIHRHQSRKQIEKEKPKAAEGQIPQQTTTANVSTPTTAQAPPPVPVETSNQMKTKISVTSLLKSDPKEYNNVNKLALDGGDTPKSNDNRLILLQLIARLLTMEKLESIQLAPKHRLQLLPKDNEVPLYLNDLLNQQSCLVLFDIIMMLQTLKATSTRLELSGFRTKQGSKLCLDTQQARKALQYLKDLSYLDLSKLVSQVGRNCLAPEEFKKLRDFLPFNNLETLKLSQTKLSLSALELLDLKSIKNLKTLKVAGCNLNTDGANLITANAPNLTKLEIQDNKILFQGAYYIMDRLASLQMLDISTIGIETFTYLFSKIPSSLKVLIAYGNGIDEAAVKHILYLGSSLREKGGRLDLREIQKENRYSKITSSQLRSIQASYKDTDILL